jgi:hypothetical protein
MSNVVAVMFVILPASHRMMGVEANAVGNVTVTGLAEGRLILPNCHRLLVGV